MSLSSLWSNLERDWVEVNIDELQGNTIAIDGQIWLYESWKDAESGICNNFLAGFHERCKALISLNITPFFIFDQYQCASLPKLSSNNDTARARSEFQFVRESRPVKVTEGARMRYGRNTAKMKNIHKVTELLDAMGIRYFKSRGVDNEAAGSFLEEEGKVIGFVSPDPEYLMYGGKQLFKIGFDSSFVVQGIKKLTAEKVEHNTGLTRGRLIALGMLLGCDYSPKKLNGIGIVSALEIISAFSLHEDDHPCAILDRFRNFYDPTFKSKAEETLSHVKMKPGLMYNFDDFNPSSDSFGEAVDAYMWPNLEDLPYEISRLQGTVNEKKVNEILTRAIAAEDTEDSSDSIDVKDSRKWSRRNKNSEASSSIIGTVETSNGVKRRAPSIASNGAIKRRNVVVSCSRSEAIAWSKREWQAILALRKATTHHINSDTASSRRPNGITVNANEMFALPAPSSSASSHLVDALPYLDTAYGETDRQHALNLIANECKIFLPTANYLKHLPVPDYDIFLTSTLMKENARMAKKEEMCKLDMSRCELPAPSSAKAGDKQSWKKAIDNARAQNEHLVVRETNLDLMEELAADGFLRRNRLLEDILSSEEDKLRSQKQSILQIHAKRKAAQLEAGSKLKDGEAAWVGMLTKNYQMEMAIEQMERENEAKAKKLKIDIESLQ